MAADRNIGSKAVTAGGARTAADRNAGTGGVAGGGFKACKEFKVGSKEFKDFKASRFQGFKDSRDFKAKFWESDLLKSSTKSRISGFKVFKGFRNSKDFRDPGISGVQGFQRLGPGNSDYT